VTINVIRVYLKRVSEFPLRQGPVPVIPPTQPSKSLLS
jgi:hypothetical protein